jgi:hypothetical protein
MSEPNILVCVDPEKIDQIWSHVAPLLSRAFAEIASDVTLESVEKSLRSGSALLWIVWSDRRQIIAAATTELWETPRHKVCVITACGGSDLQSWKHYMTDLEHYARSEGCAIMRVCGRRGWKGVFQDFREPWITLQKDLI